MGQLIKNKFLSSKSALMLSNMENLLSELESMYDNFTEKKPTSLSTLTNTLCSTNKILTDFQNLVTLFKYSSNDFDRKEESFSIEDTLRSITENLAISALSNQAKFELLYEETMPDYVFGDMIKFYQIITTLMNLANLECAKDKSANVFARLV